MDLGELIEAARQEWDNGLDAHSIGAIGPGTQITGIAYDSRRVAPGDLFCCLPGIAADGHDHAREAVAAGASALLVERHLDLGIDQVVVPDARRSMALLAAVLHGFPSRRLAVVGVTGTNGKTSVVHMLADVLRRSGRHVAESGTLTGDRTTPEAPDLQARLASWADDGVDIVCMEVSSHALAQHRVDGIGFAAVAYTNLTRDHLDYHGSMDAYAAAKQRLLAREFSGHAVVVVDDDSGRERAAAGRHSGLEVVEVATSDASVLVGRNGSRFTWRHGEVDLALPGRFAVTNALVVAELAVLVGTPVADVREALGLLQPVPGRFESLPEAAGIRVVVDYAHTPDALTAALAAAREVSTGRVICVFGCGGGRDEGKRPEMGRAAVSGADVVVVTSDNPRYDPPGGIIEDILSGMDLSGTDQSEVIVEPDRREAMTMAIGLAHSGDLVLVAGRGHEATQHVGADLLPFDDRLVAAEILELRS
ncbi:MAG: UDP-N-acetylmuramoyl-L-alanyl-D-glutamate--2,6-diaminopimelate ligase [Actinobacteria bacterium]|nr:UDP-N-acetylmuramoyl-L-alanyl-D-glutamate--2,6-diaminopimelate ligase [Actinomycetota bacterium]